MIEFKLKCIYLKQPNIDSLQVKEAATQDLVILRVGDQELGPSNYHYFCVPLHATVDIQYETLNQQSLLRIIFQLEQRNLSIQYFTWNETEQHYIEVPLKNDIIQSLSFQTILQSISFSGDNHFSYVVNSLQRFTGVLI
jgi:hypothetical protein